MILVVSHLTVVQCSSQNLLPKSPSPAIVSHILECYTWTVFLYIYLARQTANTVNACGQTLFWVYSGGKHICYICMLTVTNFVLF